MLLRISRHFLRSLINLLDETQQRVWILWHVKIWPRDTLDLGNLSRWRVGMLFVPQQESPVDIWCRSDRFIRSDVEVETRDCLFGSILAPGRGE